MGFSRVKYPEMRIELIGRLQALADPDYQQMAWINHQFPPGIVYDEFNKTTIHFLYDDTNLGGNSEADIGDILKNKEESDAVTLLVREIDVLFDRYGLNLKDGEYMSKPEWENVVCKAKDACSIFGIESVVSPDPETRREQRNR